MIELKLGEIQVTIKIIKIINLRISYSSERVESRYLNNKEK
jgi:hypothetical protein